MCFAAVSFASNGDPPKSEEYVFLHDALYPGQAENEGLIERLAHEEPNLYSLVFRNIDGTNTLKLFSFPVKYETHNGEIKDISLKLQRTGTGFAPCDFPFDISFSERIENGITAVWKDGEIFFSPAGRNGNGVLSPDGRTLTYDTGDGIKYQYSLTFDGFKENIMLNGYTGETAFSYSVNANGLSVSEDDGELVFTDSRGNKAAVMGEIIVFDSDGKTSDGYYSLEQSGEDYYVTLNVSEEFLTAADTVYPVTIDPTIVINYANNGAGAIEDVTINSTAGSSGSSGSVHVGNRTTYGISRTLMRFPALDMSAIYSADNIISARVEIRDVMCYGTHLDVNCHVFKSVWSESTVNWSNTSPNNYVSTVLDTKTIYYGNGDTALTGDSNRYSFDITAAAAGWKNGTYNKNAGIIFKTTSAIEGSTTYIQVILGSYNRATNRPSLTVIYSNPFCSTAGDINYYINNSTDDNLQYRANCYGFALRYFYSDNLSDVGGSYFQFPGEFAPKPFTFQSYGTVNNYDDLYNKTVSCLADNNILGIYALVWYDLTSLGYSVSTPFTSAPPQQTRSDMRLIGLVIRQGDSSQGISPDYHFYMQNSDGTWSHKPGNYPATNACHGCNNPVSQLTNSNILEHITDDYSDNYLFFYVSKPATIDYGHSDGTDSDCEFTEITINDFAGNSHTSAKRIIGTESSMLQGRIEYLNDTDFYGFQASASKTYQFSIAANGTQVSGTTFVLTAYQQDGSVISSSTTGSLSFTAIKGKVYYVKVSKTGQTAYSSYQKYILYWG
ncbi:MAG: DNRLRE domain-containing protein [Clostridia bacterium]|nr:DNRLRE domain-containing protein [Clostridia bacterium]